MTVKVSAGWIWEGVTVTLAVEAAQDGGMDTTQSARTSQKRLMRGYLYPYQSLEGVSREMASRGTS